MIYIDTSSLLKSFINDQQSDAVDLAIQLEPAVVVSPITELEACVQLRAIYLGGGLSSSRHVGMRQRLAEILATDPFVIRSLTGRIFSTATAQSARSTVHCRSLARLHLAAMEELGIQRLMTHDTRQADAARELGYEVVSPGLG